MKETAGKKINCLIKVAVVLVFLSASLVVTGCGGESKNKDFRQLQSQGVSVNRLGEHVMFTVPSSLLFSGGSANLLSSGEASLRLIADAIEPMTKVAVYISVYSASEKQSKKDLVITDAQAQRVAHQLWRLGIDSRLMYSTGMGGGHPVSTNKKGEPTGSMNARVVIALRDLSS